MRCVLTHPVYPNLVLCERDHKAGEHEVKVLSRRRRQKGRESDRPGKTRCASSGLGGSNNECARHAPGQHCRRRRRGAERRCSGRARRAAGGGGTSAQEPRLRRGGHRLWVFARPGTEGRQQESVRQVGDATGSGAGGHAPGGIGTGRSEGVTQTQRQGISGSTLDRRVRLATLVDSCLLAGKKGSRRRAHLCLRRPLLRARLETSPRRFLAASYQVRPRHLNTRNLLPAPGAQEAAQVTRKAAACVSRSGPSVQAALCAPTRSALIWVAEALFARACSSCSELRSVGAVGQPSFSTDRACRVSPALCLGPTPAHEQQCSSVLTRRHNPQA